MKIAGVLSKVNQFMGEVKQQIAQMVVRHLEDQLEADVEGWLQLGIEVG